MRFLWKVSALVLVAGALSACVTTSQQYANPFNDPSIYSTMTRYSPSHAEPVQAISQGELHW